MAAARIVFWAKDSVATTSRAPVLSPEDEDDAVAESATSASAMALDCVLYRVRAHVAYARQLLSRARSLLASSRPANKVKSAPSRPARAR